MSTPHAPAPSAAPVWADPARGAAFAGWLAQQAKVHRLLHGSVRIASADASFRRYLRIDTETGATRIIMDAPPTHENCAPFVHVARLMLEAGLNVPRVLAWDEAHGFMLLTDLGARTMMDMLDPSDSGAALPLLDAAIDALVRWQQASRPHELPPYGEALLRRELALFPEWYLGQYRGLALDAARRQTLAEAFDLIVRHSLASPSVYVHRDFMPRNLMAALPGASGIGVLDFQDAVYGPITYDIASLMRDAFISWDAAFVTEITRRYWHAARTR
ncbi:MAG: phosphotransferase, partial [Burkholderiaceae bacterium]|nr:phosphotransferase [Burkholderiaceae bacterium]